MREAPAGTKVPFWVRRILLRGLRSAAAERYPTMGELLEALGRDPKAERRKWAVGAAVAVLPLIVGLGVRQTLVDRRAVCEGAPDRLAGIWELQPHDQAEGPRQSQIHAAFLRTGKSYAADVWETVSRALTGYAQSWARMYKDTCEATQVRHEQSPEVLDLRMACLQERLGGLQALTDVFAQATGEVVENAVSATNAIETLDRCADVPTLRAVIRPPEDQQAVARVGDMRKLLAETKARFDAGRWKKSLQDAPELLSAARRVGYQPVLAEVLAFVGQVYMRANDLRVAERTLVEAYRVADASRHDEVRAEAATNLVFVIGSLEGQLADALRWSEAASAVLQRLGGHELLHAWLLNNLGCAYTVHREIPDAIKALRESLELKQKLLGPDHPDVAISEGNLASLLEGAKRYKEALAYVDRAIEIQEKKLGPASPALFNHLNNRGYILNALGRPEEAISSFDRAVGIWEREIGADAPLLAYALTGLGSSYLAENRPMNAIGPLERALKVRGREEQGVDPTDQAQTLFALAQALAAAGREPGRAHQLAEESRSLYVRSGTANELATVEAWLREHRST